MHRHCWKPISIVLVLIIAMPYMWAEVTVPSVLADHMVLQRDKPIHLWGHADPGERVTATFRHHEATTVADTLGRWSVYLPPSDAGGPYTLTIQGKNTIAWTDILVGDIWIASGQSNMVFPMEKTDDWARGTLNSQQEIASAQYPRIRLFQVNDVASDYPMTDVAAKTWTACTPASVAKFSAVAYFFGRELLEKEKVPIGLIESDWGGTPAGAWTSLDALSADASLMPVFALRAQTLDDQATALLQKKHDEQEQAAAKAAGRPPKPMPWYPDMDSWAPGALFNGMIAPLTPLPIRGVIWYQGENNAIGNFSSIYARLFPALIADWRAHWAQGNFPFLFVQIANYNYSGDGAAIVREAQRRTLSVANTGMAVTIDIGDADNIHPRDKQDVGHRLALWARDLSYGEHVEDSGPLFRQAVTQGNAMRIWFDHAASGLVVKDGGVLDGFEVAGADGKFVAATARVEGDTVLASASTVAKPVSVRYGWAANPRCNLYNGAGLPASPFTSRQ